jgi:hypothetical protein
VYDTGREALVRTREMQRVEEGDAGAVAVKTVEDAAAGWGEVGDREADAVADWY